MLLSLQMDLSEMEDLLTHQTLFVQAIYNRPNRCKCCTFLPYRLSSRRLLSASTDGFLKQ